MPSVPGAHGRRTGTCLPGPAISLETGLSLLLKETPRAVGRARVCVEDTVSGKSLGLEVG